MNELDTQFHTAVFGGFQKQDVMSYLEISAHENGQKLSKLQHELNEANEARSQAEKERDQAQLSLKELEAQKTELTETTAAQKEELAQLRAQLQELTEQRDSLQKELDRVTEQIQVLKPQAEGYEAIKDRTAGIELEAHGRAQIIEQEARTKAQRLQSEMDGWCGRLQERYKALRGEAEASLARAGQEMEKVKQSMDGLSAAFAEQENVLGQLQKDVEKITGPRVPEPLSTEEL